ncbi:Fe(3+) dicitrate ABC transporter ATP-binding protein FecE [Leucothrix sargassi]|nr:Fe(3+) dicitrate ABC transporter ATP-binding protein FecE [Leucothrix sargassi]
MSITTDALTVGYHGSAILKDITLTIPHGKITALLGPNGCGKSTLLKAFSSQLSPISGHVLWQEKPLTKYTAKYLSQNLALLAQTQPIPEGIKVEDLVAYGRSPYTGFWGSLTANDNEIVQNAMMQTQVDDLAKSLVSELSGGQRQRAWLAMTLAQQTPYLLLDEPTTYMDINHQVELMQTLRDLNKQGKTIVTVLHDINQAARYCDHLVIMKAGNVICQGSPEAVLTTHMLKDVFGLKAQIHSDPVAGTPMCIVDN